MAATIKSRVTRLEFDEEFYCGLIRMLFQPLKHLSPVSRAALRTRTAPARPVAEAAVFRSLDQNAPSTRILTPLFHALGQTIHMLRMKSSWKLDAEFVEQLRGSDIRKPFEAAAHQWPDHRERVVYGLAGFGIDQPWPFRNHLCQNSGGSLRKRTKRPRSTRQHRGVLVGHRRDIGSNDGLQSAQISWLGFYGKRGTDLAGSPRAGKTRHEAGEIRWLGCFAGKLAPIGECHQMRLNRAYLLQELQRVQRAGHLAQPGFGRLRKTLGLLQPLTAEFPRLRPTQFPELGTA